MTVRYMILVVALLVKCSDVLCADCATNSDCNGGTCDKATTCVCPPAQYGPNCNSSCNGNTECNNGSCTKDNVCDCPPLQTGDNCEHKNECDKNTPCQEGIDCDMTAEPFSCKVASPVVMAADENCGPLGVCGSAQHMALSLLLQLVMLGILSLM